jgi:hypothetical protein
MIRTVTIGRDGMEGMTTEEEMRGEIGHTMV